LEEMNKVCVLVPVYNVEQYIERCARSLFEQTYPNLEYVFVNDCTPDSSMEVLHKVMMDYPQRMDVVHAVNHDRNKGLAAARNTALDTATGEFVVIVDADDWLELDAVEQLVKKQLDNDVDMVSGNRIVQYTKEDGLLEERKYQSREEMTLQMMQRSWDHFVTGRLIKKSLFVDNGLRWNESYDLAEDRYMMTKLAYCSRGFDTVDHVVYHYERRNINSITSGNSGKRLKGNRQELGNVLALERFFEDKENVYQKECTRCVMEQLLFNLKEALAYAAKDEFKAIACLIDGRSEDDWKLIGWRKSGIKGGLLHNYGLMRLNWLKDKTIRFIKKGL